MVYFSCISEERRPTMNELSNQIDRLFLWFISRVFQRSADRQWMSCPIRLIVYFYGLFLVYFRGAPTDSEGAVQSDESFIFMVYFSCISEERRLTVNELSNQMKRLFWWFISGVFQRSVDRQWMNCPIRWSVYFDGLFLVYFRGAQTDSEWTVQSDEAFILMVYFSCISEESRPTEWTVQLDEALIFMVYFWCISEERRPTVNELSNQMNRLFWWFISRVFQRSADRQWMNCPIRWSVYFDGLFLVYFRGAQTDSEWTVQSEGSEPKGQWLETFPHCCTDWRSGEMIISGFNSCSHFMFWTNYVIKKYQFEFDDIYFFERIC